MEPGADFKHLIEIVSNSTEAFTAVLFLPVPSERVLKLAACCSLSRHIVEDSTIPLGHGLVGWVAEHEQHMLVSPFRHDSKTLLFYGEDESIKSFLAVPVHLRAGGVGVLAIDSKRGYVFPPKVQKLLVGYADLFAELVERSEVVDRALGGLVNFEELRAFCRKITSSESLERVLNFVANIPQGLVPHSGLSLSLALEDPARLEIVRAPGYPVHKLGGLVVDLEASLVGWVYRRGRPLYLSDLAGKRKRPNLFHAREPFLPARSFLGVPLRVADRMLGVVAFTSDHQGEFPRHTSEVLAILSDLVSLAIANAHGRSVEAHEGEGWIASYGHFHALLEQKLGEPDRRAPLSLFLVDPCNLARLNTRYGFETADRLLVEAAGRVAKDLGPGDKILPIEGGRLLVLRDGVGAEDATACAERLMRAFSDRLLAVDDVEVALTVRVAAATWPGDARNREDLLRIVFERLARLKRSAGATESRADAGAAH